MFYVSYPNVRLRLTLPFAITAAGVMPCGGPKNSPRMSSIVQIIPYFFRSFEISKNIQGVKNCTFRVDTKTSIKQTEPNILSQTYNATRLRHVFRILM